MLTQFLVASDEWTKIAEPGFTGAVWLDENETDSSGAAFIVVCVSEATPSADTGEKGKRLYKCGGNPDPLFVFAALSDGAVWARNLLNGKARVSVDTCVGVVSSALTQRSFSGDAILSTTYADDYIARGDCYQVQRILQSVPSGGTAKVVLDCSLVSAEKRILTLPIRVNAVGGPIVVKTYKIAAYTGGSIVPINRLNNLSANLKAAQAVVKKEIASSDVPGDDVREYLSGALGNPQQVNRSGSASGAMPVWFSPGVKLCLEILNSYTTALDIELSIVWYEI